MSFLQSLPSSVPQRAQQTADAGASRRDERASAPSPHPHPAASSAAISPHTRTAASKLRVTGSDAQHKGGWRQTAARRSNRGLMSRLLVCVCGWCFVAFPASAPSVLVSSRSSCAGCVVPCGGSLSRQPAGARAAAEQGARGGARRRCQTTSKGETTGGGSACRGAAGVGTDKRQTTGDHSQRALTSRRGRRSRSRCSHRSAARDSSALARCPLPCCLGLVYCIRWRICCCHRCPGFFCAFPGWPSACGLWPQSEFGRPRVAAERPPDAQLSSCSGGSGDSQICNSDESTSKSSSNG